MAVLEFRLGRLAITGDGLLFQQTVNQGIGGAIDVNQVSLRAERLAALYPFKKLLVHADDVLH